MGNWERGGEEDDKLREARENLKDLRERGAGERGREGRQVEEEMR